VVDRQVRLMDVGATLLGLVGLPASLGDGEDLRPLLRGERPEAPPSYAEASKPLNFERKDAWNNLDFERSVAVGGLFYVRTPWRRDQSSLRRQGQGWPELDDAAAASELRARLDAWDAAAPPHEDIQLDEGTRDMLVALGYLEGEP
jgi:arylsulfatase A-like enzyme